MFDAVPKAYKRPEFVSELRALLTETGTVSLECKVIGVPTPILNWFKDDKEIKAGDVFALTANPDDTTSFSVIAVNCMGTACSSSRVSKKKKNDFKYATDIMVHTIIARYLFKVHVVGKESREGSLKPIDTLIVNGEPPIFSKILKDESCRIGESLTLSCQGIYILTLRYAIAIFVFNDDN